MTPRGARLRCRLSGTDRLERLGVFCQSNRYSGLEKDGCSPARTRPAPDCFPVGGQGTRADGSVGTGAIDGRGSTRRTRTCWGSKAGACRAWPRTSCRKGMAVTGSEAVPGATCAGLRGVGVRVGTEPVARAITARTRLLVHGPEVGPRALHAARGAPAGRPAGDARGLAPGPDAGPGRGGRRRGPGGVRWPRR